MKSIGIDLGTSNTRIFIKGKGVRLNEPSCVAVSDTEDVVTAVGLDAARMVGKTPDSVSVLRPVKSGVIAQFDVAVAMMEAFLKKTGVRLSGRHPRVIASVPYSVNDVEKRAVEEVILDAGAKSVALIETALVAAVGAGIRVTRPHGSIVVDIGGGTTEAAVMSLGGIVVARSLRVGGDTFDEAICDYVRRKYNVQISETTAEYCKRCIGTVVRPEESLVRRTQESLPGSPVSPRGNATEMEVRGRDVITGLPVGQRLTAADMVEATAEPMGKITDSIRSLLEETPPELSADLYGDGILLTGGGALMGGICQQISQATHLKTTIAKNPMECSVQGIGRLLAFQGDIDRIIKFRSK
ncbi:MAG: rod shape-determining protein [Clostridia bacterium]|nr:rod shape-determining protein [Clostridia bacterium]